MSKSTIIDNPITSYKWIWDKNKDPLDFGFRKLVSSENEYTKTYPLWKYHGYTTIYATWWLGQDIAVASNGEIEVGYWYTEDRPFEAVPYLCNLDLYDASPDSCVYLFSGQETLEIAAAEAESRGVVLELVHYIPEQDLYFCTSAANLMQVIN